MANKICGIYGIQNTLTGEWYVGQSKDIRKRWVCHLSSFKHGKQHSKPMQEAYDRYGIEAFAFSVLEECLPHELNEKEAKWVAVKDAFGHGYNLNLGSTGFCGVACPDEYREKMSKRMKTASAHLRKPVVCVETGVVYESLTAAAKAVDRTFATLSEARRDGKTCAGYHWQYAEGVSACG